MNRANHIAECDAATIAAMVTNGEASALEVVDAALDRIAALDPQLHAFCTLIPEQARAAAVKLDRLRSAGGSLGPLAGVPVAIKDLISTKGIRTTFGSKAYESFVPVDDDVIVERLVAAGAIVLGKTNASEFGYGAVGHNSVFQTTRNPWNLDLTSGGSSAGSAVAVATGMAPIAAGSDGGGSVRIPAALCGVVGFKPSMGRVPLYPSCRDERYPGASGWESIEHLGPLTRTVADAALVLSVIAGPDDRDRHSLPAVGTDWVAVCKEDGAGLRIGYSPAFEAIDVDPDVSSVAADAVTIFETCLGGTIELVKPDFDAFAWAFLGIVMLESDLTGMRDLAKRHRGEMSPYLVDLLSRQWTAEELSRAVVARKAVANKMWQLMRNFDLFITPTVATPAFPIDLMGPSTVNGKKRAVEDWAPFTWPMNFTGQPAISVPAGFTPSGLPVGIQISGRHLDDAGVLRAAAAFERVRPWRHHWPGIVRNTTTAALSPTI